MAINPHFLEAGVDRNERAQARATVDSRLYIDAATMAEYVRMG
jgi:hypothetical protein